MDIKSPFICICLWILYCIYYSRAASDDEHRDPAKKRYEKWTADQEKDLIYFDVLTDTGEPNHFDRIRNMWRQEYPESNVTDGALRVRLRKIRMESLEEGEYKSRFHWSENLKRELLDVYHNTRPYKRNASTTLEEEWKRRHPDYHSEKKTLQRFVRHLLKEEMFQECIPRNEESERNYRHQWTAECNNELRSLMELTDTGEPHHFERIRSRWLEKYPNSKVTDSALLTQCNRLQNMLKTEGERKKQLKWNEESDRELLDLYSNTYPYKTDVNITLEDEWNRRHQDHQAKRRLLTERAQKLIKGNKYSEYTAHEPSITDIEWNNQHDSELMHVYNVALSKGGPYLRRTQQIWAELHPQYKHVTPEQLKERLDHLKMNPPNVNFPWRGREDKELLRIYDETMPNEEDQGQRIYDIWSRRHPRYKFMTPYYLQVHASTLARKREVKANGKNVRLVWTHEEKSDLVNMVHYYPRDQKDGLHAFHKEWVRKHPRHAYRNNSDLLTFAKRFEKSGIRPRSLEEGEGSRSKVLELGHKTRNKYTTRQKEELRDLLQQIFPKTYGHARRVKKEWYKRHEDMAPIKSTSLRALVKRWEERGPDKRTDKAPMMYSSDKSEPSSPTIDSEESE